METTYNEASLIGEIRTTLFRFCCSREHAIETMRRKGHHVPAWSKKVDSIQFIRVHLEAAEGWNLMGHIRLVSNTLRPHIHAILPFEFHEQDRLRHYRKHILELLCFCDDRMPKKQISLFTQKTQTA